MYLLQNARQSQKLLHFGQFELDSEQIIASTTYVVMSYEFFWNKI